MNKIFLIRDLFQTKKIEILKAWKLDKWTNCFKSAKIEL